MMATDDDVRRIALSLPGAYEQASYGGAPSFRTNPRSFAWLRDDPAALVLWVASEEHKDELIAADPAVYFTTAHYDGHPIVLARVDKLDSAELTEMLTESWRLRAPTALVRTFDADQADRG